jgi:hypothetical protein
MSNLFNYKYLAITITAWAFILSASALGNPLQVQMPVTLLDLYRKSDAVFEARFDKTQEGDAVRQEADYSVVSVRKLFDITSTLKGNHQKFFVLNENEYRYPTPAPNYLLARSGQTAANGDVENTYGLQSGDSVLLFVKYAADGKTLELTNDEEGLKKLSSDEMAVYEKRIRELEPLLSAGKPSATVIVDWMMRCAEEPATRWEATFELVKGFERLDFQRKQKAGAVSDAEQRGLLAADRSDFFDATTFAKALTDEQKRRLADILLDRQQPQFTPDGEAKRTLIRGDRELIDLVKHWGDPRLPGFLIDELKTKDLTDYRRSETMSLIADILGNEKALGLADKYSNTYRDEAFAAEIADGSDQETVVKPDYKKIRESIMTRFIRAANEAFAQRQNSKN